MSNLEVSPRETDCGGLQVLDPPPPPQTLLPRAVPLGGPRAMSVNRTLPHRDIRTIGAWCFVDHFGPGDVPQSAVTGMNVPPHPHMGLQTVSWLLSGEVKHRDSVGGHALIRPGQLNVMTAGHGIAHSEYSRSDGQRPFGAQLWVALPEQHRAQRPHFEHHADLPDLPVGGLSVRVIMGEVDSVASPAATYSPIVGAAVSVPSGASGRIPLHRDFEYGVLVTDGNVDVAGTDVPSGALRYLGWGNGDLHVRSSGGAQVLLLGGEPMTEHLLMWWNFVGRNHDEIVEARRQWQDRDPRFGDVVGDDTAWLPAPELPTTRLKPRPPRR